MLLEAVCNQVLSEDRVHSIFSDCAANVDALQGKEGKDLQRLIKAKAETQRRLANLYKLVEDGFDQNEESLKKRLRTHQEELQALSVKINDLKIKVLVPKSIFHSVAMGGHQGFFGRDAPDVGRPAEPLGEGLPAPVREGGSDLRRGGDDHRTQSGPRRGGDQTS